LKGHYQLLRKPWIEKMPSEGNECK
jgi:hypothetical protein